MIAMALRRTRERLEQAIKQRLRRGLRQAARSPQGARLIRFLRADTTRGNLPAPDRERMRWISTPTRLLDGLCITGYLRSEIGLGQAARCLAYACDSQRLPLSFRHLPLPGRDNDEEFGTKCNQIADRKANLLVIGLSSIVALQDEIRGGQTNILYPFWELSRIPAQWLTVASRFDEIWAPSSFVAAGFQESFGRPVRTMRPAVRLPPTLPEPRPLRDRLRFFTYLDFDSYATRKNPMATVMAFKAAFGAEHPDVELVVKTRGVLDGGSRALLGSLTASDPRIRIIDRILDRQAMDALMKAADVFVSLHRSEGFGYGAAEALAAGKAVIATDYGGTTDFVSQASGYPVDYDLVSVRPGEYVAVEGQVWAEPRQESAVAAMRAIFDDPDEAWARAAHGFEVLRRQYAPQVVGAEMERQLRELGLV